MSTIVVVRKNGVAAMAGDFQTCQGDITVPGALRVGPGKIHRVGEAFLGIVGSMAHQNVIRSLFINKPELFRLESYDEVFETLRRIQPLLCSDYYLRTDERGEHDQEYESVQLSGLVISKGGIFSFGSHREVAEYNSFWAAGSGMEFALGALQIAYSASDQDAKTLAENAVKAACVFDSGSGLPVESYQLTLQQ